MSEEPVVDRKPIIQFNPPSFGIAGWWMKWRLVIWLLLLTGISVGVNIWQWKSSIEDHQKFKDEKAASYDKAKAEVAARQIEAITILLQQAAADRAALDAAEEAVKAGGTRTVTKYRDRVAKGGPTPTCSVNDAQIAALKEALAK